MSIYEWYDPLNIAKRSLRKAMIGAKNYAQGKLLDIGCGVKPYAGIFNHVEKYVGIELPTTLSESTVVDVYADALNLPFKNSSFDTVLCNQVLEHVPKPSQLLKETNRVLKSGGYLILSAPQVWGLHEIPHDYYRYTKYGLQYLARINSFRVIKIIKTCGTWATAGQRICSLLFQGYLDKPEIIKGLIGPLCFLAQLIFAGLDKLAGERGDTLDNVLIAQKI